MNRRKEEIIKTINESYNISYFGLLPNELLQIIYTILFEGSIQIRFEINVNIDKIYVNIDEIKYTKHPDTIMSLYNTYAFDIYDFLYKFNNQNPYHEIFGSIKDKLYYFYRHILHDTRNHDRYCEIDEYYYCNECDEIYDRDYCRIHVDEELEENTHISLNDVKPIVEYQTFFNTRINLLLNLINKQNEYIIIPKQGKTQNINKRKRE